MNWRKEPPTVQGFYWWRETDGAREVVIEVDGDGTVFVPGTEDTGQAHAIGGEWGPRCLPPSEVPAPVGVMLDGLRRGDK